MKHTNKEIEDAHVAFAIEYLQVRGYQVLLMKKWRHAASPGELAKLAGIAPTALCNRLKKDTCPPFDCERGPSGRILSIVPNPALVAFLKQPGQPGVKLKPAHKL
ncbi:MAG: hypothetical protein JW388_0965 [Nitrospira sp.]|nr:hypothetical protein [Nitrospira sp.]